MCIYSGTSTCDHFSNNMYPKQQNFPSQSHSISINIQSILYIYTFSIYNHIYTFEYICMQLKLNAINSLPESRLRQDLSFSWNDPLWFDSHK